MQAATLSFILIVFSFLVSGCVSSKYYITYDTDPAGAEIICEGESQGLAPVTLEYNNLFESNYRTELCQAVWKSGARAYFPNDWSKLIGKFPNGLEYIQKRPEHPDLEKDIQFASQFAIDEGQVKSTNIK